MDTLYILGNGFDLHHKLPTSYADFNKSVVETDPELAHTLEEYFTFKVNHKYLWCDFECDLGTFASQSFFDFHNGCDPLSENFRYSEVYAVEDEVREAAENLIESIRDAFSQWIDGIEFPEQPSRTTKLLNITDRSKFITFNYTATLEELYHISDDRIFYIHNKAGGFNGELIFGHGLADDEKQDDTLDEFGESSRTMFTDAEGAARSVFYAFRKDTDEVINEHGKYFRELAGTKNIIVLGHSIADVDNPYFQLIAKQAPGASWTFSYFGDQELEEKKNKAAAMLGIDKKI